MTIFLRGKNHLTYHLKNLAVLQRLNYSHNHSLSEGGLQTQLHSGTASNFMSRQNYVVDTSKWRKVDSKDAGIQRGMIPDAPWMVLKLLRSEGYEAYLVGGCVRDLILNRVPKDFDVITTASLKQIKKKFNNAMIVGRRFPICIVHLKGSTVEVSSFATSAKQGEEKEKVIYSRMPGNCDKKDFIRWRNSMQRDFTVNSLFLDPFKNQIYDYANGMLDLRSLKLRTLVPAQLSFEEDCARILRGLRIAGRLGLSISNDIETAIYKISSSLFNLGQSRIMMELNYMLSYGSAEPTIYLLRRFKLLEIFLPFHAAYLDQQTGKESVQSSIMLMKLFSNLDRIVRTDRPCDCSLWVGLLAFHQALVINPQDALVIWMFASVLYHGTWKEGLQFAKENMELQVKFEPEVTGRSEFKSDEKLVKEVSQLVSLVQDSAYAFTDTSCLSKSMSKYPDFPCPGLVFVPKKAGYDVAQLVDVLVDSESNKSRRDRFMIDYRLLGKGDLHENRFALGKVILETLSGELLEDGMEFVKGKPGTTQQNLDPSLSAIMKDLGAFKNNRKRILSPSDTDQNQKVAKKEKLVQMKRDETLKDESCGAVNLMQIKILEEAKLILHQPEVPNKKHQTLEENSARKKVSMAEKPSHSKAENEKDHISHDTKAKGQLNVIEQCNLRKENKTKQEEKTDTQVQQVIKEKTKVSAERKKHEPSLSSLL